MASLNAAAQHEVMTLLRILPGDRVLEVGHGPGTLLRMVADHTDAALIAGVDPSLVMREQAAARCHCAITAGRVELHVGTASHTGQPDQYFDHVVSVNNVVLWEDLPAGVQELHRVLRTGGCLVVACHSRSSRSWHERRIGLRDHIAARVEAAISDAFGSVQRHDLAHIVAFTAARDDS